ncbi:hypothetical protein Tco_0226747 [Tanacetum coccineum]
MFGEDAIPRPSRAPRKSKSQCSSASSSATFGSSKNRLTEFFQEQIQLDREAKKESLDRELAARLAVVELQKRNEDLKILTFDTTGMNSDDAAKIEDLKAKARAICDSSGDLYPVTQPSLTLHALLSVSTTNVCTNASGIPGKSSNSIVSRSVEIGHLTFGLS